MTSAFKPSGNAAPILTGQVKSTILSPLSGSDPVARQYHPSAEEDIILALERADPIGDDAHTPVKGVVHRYPDRALLKITDTCSIYCRFCFRKEMVGKGDGVLTDGELDAAIAYIQKTPAIREIILTGGDPFTLSNRRMKAVLERLEQIDHLDIIRFHTRTPLVKPDRVDEGLIDIFRTLNKALYVVVHVNHAQEIDRNVKDAFVRLSRSGAVLLSQSVLLKGVNDSVDTLETLFRTLLACRVKPYYLHHPDLAPGTGHFRVTIKQGQDIMRALRGNLSGLGYPFYVLDLPGGYGKIPLIPNYVEDCGGERYVIEDYQGGLHAYPPETT